MQENHHADPASGEQLRILVADDSSDDATIIRLAFDQAAVAAELHFVGSGEEVVRFLQSSPETAQEVARFGRPNLLLLDLKMPGMEGFQVLEWLRNHPPFDRIPVVVFSGSDQPVDINRALALGAIRYLVKPEKMSDMIQMVRGIEKFWEKLRSESNPELLPERGKHGST